MGLVLDMSPLGYSLGTRDRYLANSIIESPPTRKRAHQRLGNAVSPAPEATTGS